MTPSERDDELSYHVRELHADLRLIRANLETAAASSMDRSIVRAWISSHGGPRQTEEVNVVPPSGELVGCCSTPLRVTLGVQVAG